VTAFTNFFQYYNGNLNPPYQYTNYSGGITNTTVIVSNLAGVVFLSNSVSGTFRPAPTNLPPLGNQYIGPSLSWIPSATSMFPRPIFSGLPVYSTNPVVLSAPGYGAPSGTLTFDDYQMSAFIDVPVNWCGQSIRGLFPRSAGRHPGDIVKSRDWIRWNRRICWRRRWTPMPARLSAF